MKFSLYGFYRSSRITSEYKGTVKAKMETYLSAVHEEKTIEK